MTPFSCQSCLVITNPGCDPFGSSHPLIIRVSPCPWIYLICAPVSFIWQEGERVRCAYRNTLATSQTRELLLALLETLKRSSAWLLIPRLVVNALSIQLVIQARPFEWRPRVAIAKGELMNYRFYILCWNLAASVCRCQAIYAFHFGS